ncbi:DUF333 domain-containing protein, partial [Candidatus Woesearchaeota archaeon]|nr:DUF333 domain-containing protein [Candidatus Woesearchaeota archaeon]
MKKKEVILLVFILIVLAMPAYAIPGPEALYCTEMQHEYSITDDGSGGQKGICNVDGVRCDAWEFYKGRCEPEKSVCAVMGYGTLTVQGSGDPYSPEYALCVEKEGNQITGNAVLQSGSNIIVKLVRWLASYMITGHAVAEDLAEEPQGIPAIELTGIKQKILNYTLPPEKPDTLPEGPQAEMQAAATPGPMAPASLDWRNYNGYNWVTPVRNQGSCGSCWAFSAIGSMEAKKNIQHSNPYLDPDIAEEYVVSDCLTNSVYDTCCGGYNSDVFQYARDSGITDESCFPYSESCDCPSLCGSSCTYSTLIPFACSDWTCSNRCGTWSSRLWTISSYTYSSSPSDATIKQYLYDYGPLSVCLGIGSSYGGSFDGNNIYRCTDDSGTNHCVVLVGYNDSGGYWIIKNSWGSGWNGDGYYKLGYGECHVSKITYASSVNSNFPTASLTSPASGVWTNADPINFTFSVNTVAASTATCQLIVGGTVRATNSSTQDSVSTTLGASLSDGSYTWYVSCWENGVGAIDDSSSRTINVDRTPPSLTINTPQQTVYGSPSVLLDYTASDPRGLHTCWFTNTTG